jgi:ankyrin repeat protein
MKALKDGNDWEADALLYSGADVNVKDNDGWTPLMYAVRYQNSEKLVSMLIGKGAEIRVSNTFGASPLILAAQYSENPAVLSHLLAAYSAGEESVSNALVFCLTGRASSERIRIAKVQLFIEKGVPLNRFYEGKTPLMYAAENCTSTDIISMLLDSGAIVSIRTADGKSAFDFAQANARLPRDKVFWSLNTGKN